MLSRRALNRATLARQWLLARESRGVSEALTQLLALQAQLARPPHVALWSRLEGFEREALNRATKDRSIVRATSLRGTLHLMTAEDYAQFRPTLQAMLSRALHTVLRERASGLAFEQLAVAARDLLAKGPRTFETLRGELAVRFPKSDERALGFAVRMTLPLVQVPTDDAWGFSGTSAFADAVGWLGRPLTAAEHRGPLLRRALAAIGPASVADLQTWTGLASLSAEVGALRGELETFRDERGKELFDLPDAPRPSEDTAAPVRFLPDFDNVLLAHADRARFIPDAHRAALATKNLRVLPVFMVDGFAAGTWSLTATKTKKAVATLTLQPFEKLSAAVRRALGTEGEALARFLEPRVSDAKVVIA